MKTVLANGCFDPLHYGHLRHLKAAKAMGTRLVVSVTVDSEVNKGDGRPVFPAERRAEMLRELRCVDDVILCSNVMEALQAIKPHIFVKGSDYKGKIQKVHYDYCKANNIKIAFTDEPAYSSTMLLSYYVR